MSQTKGVGPRGEGPDYQKSDPKNSPLKSSAFSINKFLQGVLPKIQHFYKEFGPFLKQGNPSLPLPKNISKDPPERTKDFNPFF